MQAFEVVSAETFTALVMIKCILAQREESVDPLSLWIWCKIQHRCTPGGFLSEIMFSIWLGKQSEIS